MNLTVIRSRTGSSRADFFGIEPRLPSPVPEERRSSQLNESEKIVRIWDSELRDFKGGPLFDVGDPPTLLVDGASEPMSCLEIYSSAEGCKYDALSIMLPFLMIPVKVTTDLTLEYLKNQIFARLKKTEIPGYTWEPSNYVFKCINRDTGEMEPFYHEDLVLKEVPYAPWYSTLFLYPREGAHAERELDKQISNVLGYGLNKLEEIIADEHRDCRARLWHVVNDNLQKTQSGLKHFAFPEEIYFPPIPELFMPQVFRNKISVGRLVYGIYYCLKQDEIEGNDKKYAYCEVDIDELHTPDSLIEKALYILKQTGNKMDHEFDEKYILQLVGRKSYLTGNKRAVVNYMKIRSLLENYKCPKFVIRRQSIVLGNYKAPRALAKPHFVMVEENRMELEKAKEQVTSIWNVDEMILIQPISYSVYEPHKDPNATVVCVFSFYVGKALIDQYASEEISQRNPRWDKIPIYTDFYIKDIPESLSLCVQLYEVIRKERTKSKSVGKKDEDALKKEKDRQAGKGWPEFLQMLREQEAQKDGIVKGEEKISINCVGWYHVPLFNWQRRLHFATYTYSLWAGEPELGRSNMCESKGDIKSNYRVTIEMMTTYMNSRTAVPRECQAVDDTRWDELCPLRGPTNELFTRDKKKTDYVLEKLHNMYSLRIQQGYLDMTTEFLHEIWDLRHIWSVYYPDALLLLMENRFMWTKREYFGEIYNMIMKGAFKVLSLQTCIAILASSHGDRIIREYATTCADKNLEDRNMPNYTLPLVQALKLEPRVFSALACMLLRRSMKNWKVGHKVFWLLRSELMLLKDTVGADNKLFKKIAILLEAYLRGNEERLPSFTKQVGMVEFINKLTVTIKSAGPRDVATKKLREELREKFTLLENVDSPLDTTATLGELIIDKCKVLGSAKVPIRLAWKNPLPFAEQYLSNIEIIFKSGDDLRQDMLVLQMLEVMEECWNNMGMDCSLSIYPVLPTGKMLGMIGVVPNSCTIFQIQSEGGKMGTAVKSMDTTFLNKFIRGNSTTPKDYIESVERFMMSCVGYSVGTYIMGIKDRHNDNIMVSKDGKLFHIDFGHILGHGKKKLGIQRDRVPFILVEHFLCVIGKGQPVTKDSKETQHFRKLCIQAYKRLFNYRHLFVAIFTAMKQMELPELSTEKDLEHVRKTLCIKSQTEEEAGASFDEVFEEALNGSWSTKTNWFFHTVKHM